MGFNIFVGNLEPMLFLTWIVK